MSLPLNLAIRSATGNPSGWNERMLNSNLKPYEEIKISSKDKCVEIIKVNIIITVCNSTFYFLYDLKDKCIRILIYVIGHRVYKDIICNINNRKKGQSYTGEVLYAIKVGINSIRLL